jgi:hypothetical protein
MDKIDRDEEEDGHWVIANWINEEAGQGYKSNDKDILNGFMVIIKWLYVTRE